MISSVLEENQDLLTVVTMGLVGITVDTMKMLVLGVFLLLQVCN